MGLLLTITTSRHSGIAKQLRDGCTTDLPSTTEDYCGEILIHK
jgi:hypothetical protein